MREPQGGDLIMEQPAFRNNPNIGKTKVGIILPSVNCITEPEFYAVSPPGISFHTTRVFLGQTTPEDLIKMDEGLDEAGRLIETIKPHAVVYACTSGSFIKGTGWDLKIIEKLEGIVGCPVTTTSTAMLKALEALGVKRVALATPYLDVVNTHEKAFLNSNGYEVVACEGLGLSGQVIREQTPQTVYDLTLRTDVSEAEAVFISCTDFRAMEVIEALENTLRKPVLSSNQVTLWSLLKILDYMDNITGYGRLLAEMP
jgi:maleate isomerase